MINRFFFVFVCLLGLTWASGCGSETSPATDTIKPPPPDTAGMNTVVPMEGDSALIAPAMAANGKWGYINEKGQWVIAPQYDQADIFTEDLAPVAVVVDQMFKDYKYINPRGETVFEFKNVVFCSQWVLGHAMVGFGNKEQRKLFFRFIDKKGKIIEALPEFTTNYYWRDLPFPVVDPKTSKVGFIDSLGRTVIKPQYDGVEATFASGICPVKVGGMCGYINTKGTMIVPPTLSHAFSAYYGYAVFRDSLTKTWGVVDSLGRKRMSPDKTLEFYSLVTNGLIGVKKEGKWGFMDLNMNWVIEPVFVDLQLPNDFSHETEGLRPVVMTSGAQPLIGFVDRAGKTIIPPRFSDVRFFRHGLSAASTGFDQNRKFGFIDKQGNWAIPERFYDIGSFVKVKL
jgi:WG containing repeat